MNVKELIQELKKYDEDSIVKINIELPHANYAKDIIKINKFKNTVNLFPEK